MISQRDLIRQQAEETIRKAGKPLHNSVIADNILPGLGLAGTVTPKTVNTCLYDDPGRRFVSVGKGTWWLRDLPNSRET